jgi:hypothetical protein
MSIRLWLRLGEIVVPLSLAAILLATWRADLRDRARLAADLAAAQQILAQATARQHERDAQLVQTLAALAAEKRTILTPAQIVRELPQQIPLPTPITLRPSNSVTNPSDVTCSSGPKCGPEGLESTRLNTIATSKAGPRSTGQQAILPADDLKPLYDFALDCKACQAKLAASQADLTDERAKTAVLTRERDEAVRAAKGGSLLRRVARNAKWLAIGVMAGAIAAKAHP